MLEPIVLIWPLDPPTYIIHHRQAVDSYSFHPITRIYLEDEGGAVERTGISHP